MKKLFIVLVMAVAVNIVTAQVYTARATELTIRDKTEGTWSEWSDFIQTDNLLVWMTETSVKIYSRIEQEYKVISVLTPFVSEDGIEFYPYLCVDQDGDTCYVTLLKLSHNAYLMVAYSDVEWCYLLNFEL